MLILMAIAAGTSTLALVSALCALRSILRVQRLAEETYRSNDHDFLLPWERL